MSPLQTLLHTYRTAALTEREKGTYFEDLTLAYFRNEAYLSSKEGPLLQY